MTRLLKAIIIATVLASAPALNALTLNEARAMAEQHYPLVRDYNLIPLSEHLTIENASKAWLPQVGASLQATLQSDVASYPQQLRDMLAATGVEIKGMSKFQYKAAIEVNQLIWDGGRIKAAREAAAAESAAQSAEIAVEQYKLRERVDALYFGILLMEQQLAALRTTETLLSANLDKMRSLVKNGTAIPANADAIEVELLATRQQATSVEGTIAEYRAVLGLYIGTDGTEPLAMPEMKLPPASNATLSRPELKLLDARLGTINARESEINASVMPRVGAFAQGYFGYPGMNFMEAMMNRNPSFNAMVGVTATWSISPLYTKRNRLSQLQVARDRIETSRRVFDFGINLQAERERRQLTRLQQTVEDDARIIELRERVRQASEAQLRQGVVDPTDLLLHITEEKNTRIQAATHHIQYLKALYSLDNILNQ